MRLVCPNCDAQYEVDVGAIPAEGRDVQCSACGHAWFQFHPDHAPEPEAEDLPPETPGPVPEVVSAPAAQAEPVSGDAPEVSEDAPAPVPQPEPLAAAQPDPAAAAALPEAPPAPETPAPETPAPETPAPETPAPETPVPAARDAAGEDSDEAPAPPPPPRRSLDDAVLAVLKEEAEREAAARRAEASRGIETQPDLGLSAAAAPVAAAPLAAAPARTDPRDEEGLDGPAGQRPAGARRDLLPDIEEINSSLRAGAEPREAPEPDPDLPVKQDRGFRSGFVAILVIAFLLVAVYVMAPRIAAMIPASAGAIEAYVTTIDGLRLGLDGLLKQITALLRGATGG